MSCVDNLEGNELTIHYKTGKLDESKAIKVVCLLEQARFLDMLEMKYFHATLHRLDFSKTASRKSAKHLSLSTLLSWLSIFNHKGKSVSPPCLVLEKKRRPEEFNDGVHNYVLRKVLGKGSFARVLLVSPKYGDHSQRFALKVMRKDVMVGHKHLIRHVATELKVLQAVKDMPYIVQMRFSFQTQGNVFIGMDYCKGGELFYHLQREKRFEETEALLFAGQIVVALGYLHKASILFRDLKPENLLMDMQGERYYISICVLLLLVDYFFSHKTTSNSI